MCPPYTTWRTYLNTAATDSRIDISWGPAIYCDAVHQLVFNWCITWARCDCTYVEEKQHSYSFVTHHVISTGIMHTLNHTSIPEGRAAKKKETDNHSSMSITSCSFPELLTILNKLKTRPYQVEAEWKRHWHCVRRIQSILELLQTQIHWHVSTLDFECGSA